MNVPSQAVVFCGGRGERLRPLTDNLPKPMAPVLGRPFLEYLIEQLRDGGAQRILLLTGYRGEQIARHFGDGSRFGVPIEYHQGPDAWETGRRLAEAAPLLDPQFLLLYADNLAPVSLPWLAERHHQAQMPLTLTVVRKSAGNLRLTSAGLVDCYDASRRQEGLTHVEIGFMIAERDAILGLDPGRGSFSLTLSELARQQRLAAFDPGCFYHSISDLDRLRFTEEYVRPKKILLVDRDGVLNRKAARGEYIWRREDFVWIPETLAGLETLARAGFEFIIISNQAGIGRGIVPAAAVAELHEWMIDHLRERGIPIRDLFLCPHHWDEGCACRKPMPGLFFAAAKKHAFRLDRTIYIGDDDRDVLAAWRAGCRCLLLADEAPISGVIPWRRSAHLSTAVPEILAYFAESG